MRQMVYTRYSNDRNPNFNIRTTIYKEDSGEMVVEKVGMDKRAEKHIKNIYKNYLLLKQKNNNPNIEINKVEYKDGVLIFDYIEGNTLSKKIEYLVKKGNINGVLEIAQKFNSYLQDSQIKKTFEMTDEFINIFGEVNFSNMQETLEVTNIDLSMDNIVVNDKINILDYEWVFTFPIPIKYVLYRNLNNFLNRWRQKLEHFLPTLFQMLGISEQEVNEFNKMENNFLQYVNKDHYNIYTLYSMQKKNVFDINKLIEEKRLIFNSAQIFFDEGTGFSEITSYRVEYKEFNGQENILELPIKDNFLNLRFDPLDRACIMKINSLYAYKMDGSITEVDFISNAKYVLDNILFFETDDPQIVFNDINLKHINSIKLEFNIYQIETSTKEIVNNLITKNNRILAEEEKKKKIEKFISVGMDYIEAERKELIDEVDKLKHENLKLQEVKLELQKAENEIKEIKQNKIWKMYEWLCRKLH